MSPKKHNTILMMSTILIFWSLSLASQAMGQDENYSRRTLAGVKGVCPIVIGKLPGVGEKSGEKIQADIESELRMAGIDVLSEAESLMSPGQPTLEVTIRFVPLQQQGEYIFYITTALFQNVILERNNKIGISSTTWFTDILVVKPKIRELHEVIKYQMNLFINAYLSVNTEHRNKPKQKKVNEPGLL